MTNTKARFLRLTETVTKAHQVIDRLKAELAAWQTQFGTAQLSHAVAEREKLKADNEALRGNLEKWAAACNDSRLGLVLPLPPIVQALNNALEACKAENERLSARMRVIGCGYCGETLWEYQGTFPPSEEALAEAVAAFETHDRMCPKNPLAAENARLRGLLKL